MQIFPCRSNSARWRGLADYNLMTTILGLYAIGELTFAPRRFQLSALQRYAGSADGYFVRSTLPATTFARFSLKVKTDQGFLTKPRRREGEDHKPFLDQRQGQSRTHQEAGAHHGRTSVAVSRKSPRKGHR